MLTRIGHVVLVVALLAATGTHWALLQTVAWTGMLASNLHDGSFVEAVEKTFDGKHPCCLCKQIAAGKKSEKKTEFPMQLKRLEFLFATPQFVFSAPTLYWCFATANPLSKSICHTPPTPPPRGIFA